ncbi:MAG: RDD family protein [Syntrophobacteraceae bacterium]|nr:RDD family protein [Syntrophobacteraceae bacterium]
MRSHRTKSIAIRTPEGVVFSLHAAGPISRFLACLIDLSCVFAAISLVSRIVQIVAALNYQVGLTLYVLAAFIISIGYTIGFEWFWRGQTVGKRLLGLRVVDEGGLRLKLDQIVIRNLLRFVDSFPLFYLLGGIICVISPKGQRMGDLAANTIVVRNPEIIAPNLQELIPDKYNSLREYPVLAARLRRSISAEEAFLALRALLRRDELEPPARISVFNELAAHFKALVKFPPEALESIADERYVRNVMDIVFRDR